MVEVIVIEEGHYVNEDKTLGVLKLARVPVKGEYLVINNQRYKVQNVEFHDNGKVIIQVD